MVSGLACFLGCRFLLFGVAQVSHGFRLQCRIAGHCIEPVTNHPSPAQRGCFARQDEEGGLEAILRIGLVAQNTPANSQDHPPMPLHQRLEGILVPVANKTVQQLVIVSRAAVVKAVLPQKADKRPKCSGCHRDHSWNGSSIYLYTSPRRAFPCMIFSQEGKFAKARGRKWVAQWLMSSYIVII